MSHHLHQKSRCNWKTPFDIVWRATEVFGGRLIGLDPASSSDNPTRAVTFLTEGGLEHDWTAHESVFLNPPWSKKRGLPIEPWIEKLLAYTADTGCPVIGVCPASTNAKWFHRLVWGNFTVAFPDGRVEYVDPDGADKESGGATFDSCVLYAGPDVLTFRSVFGDIAFVP